MTTRVNSATSVCIPIHGMWGSASRFEILRPVIQEYMTMQPINLQRTLRRTLKLSDWIEQAKKFIKSASKDFEHTYLLGHSMGCIVAMKAASALVAEGKKINGIALISPAPPNGTLGKFGFLKRIFSEAGLSSLRQINQLFQRGTRPTNKEARRVICNQCDDLGIKFDTREWEKLSPRIFLEVAFGIGTEVKAKDIENVPIDIVVGSKDKLTRQEEVEQVARQIGAKSFKVIPGHDHMSILHDENVFHYLMQNMLSNGNGRL